MTSPPERSPRRCASLAASPALAGDSLAFKIAEDQQVIVNPSDTAFSVSGTGCTGKDAAVGIALHTSKGEMSTIVKATPDAEGNWSTTLNIPELVKSTGVEAKTDGSTDGWSIGAMGKGVGMMAPSLATMLVVLTTDVHASPEQLDEALRHATSYTFDRLDVDGATSTNDTVLLLSSGASEKTCTQEELNAAVREVCDDLAAQPGQGGAQIVGG
mgnify:CR=1 FL=1